MLANLADSLLMMATPEPMSDWSLTTVKEKLISIGAKVVSHSPYITFQMAEVAIRRHMLQEILRLNAELRPNPLPTPASDDRCSCIQERPTGGLRPDAKEKWTIRTQERHSGPRSEATSHQRVVPPGKTRKSSPFA